MIRQLRLLELYYQVHLEDDNRYWVTAKEDLALTETFSVVFSSLGVLRMLNKEKQRWNKADIYRHRIIFIQRKNPSWVLTFTDFLPRRPSRTILSLRVSLRAPRERLFCWVNHYSLPPWHPLFHSPVSSYSLGSFFFTFEWKLWSSKALYLLKRKKEGGG